MIIDKSITDLREIVQRLLENQSLINEKNSRIVDNRSTNKLISIVRPSTVSLIVNHHDTLIIRTSMFGFAVVKASVCEL